MTVMTVGRRLPRHEARARMETRGFLRRWYRIEARVLYFAEDGTVRRVYGHVTEWHRSRRDARAAAMQGGVPEKFRHRYAVAVAQCR